MGMAITLPTRPSKRDPAAIGIGNCRSDVPIDASVELDPDIIATMAKAITPARRLIQDGFHCSENRVARQYQRAHRTGIATADVENLEPIKNMLAINELAKKHDEGKDVTGGRIRTQLTLRRFGEQLKA